MYLTLVTDKNTSGLKKGKLFLYESKIVDTPDGNEEAITASDLIILDNSSNKFRPIKCSELYNKLKSKCWGNFGMKYVSTVDSLDETSKSTNFTIKGKLTSPELSGFKSEIPTVYTSVSKDRNIDNEIYSDGYKLTGETLTNEDILSIENEYLKLFGSMNEVNEIYFYRSGKNIIDLVNSSVSFNIIDYNSDTYINSLNFYGVIKHAVQRNLSGIANVSIQYVKNGNIYHHDETIPVFNYITSDKILSLNIDNFIINVNNDIQLEYLNGELKLFPIGNNITELIISNCTLTYGNLTLRT